MKRLKEWAWLPLLAGGVLCLMIGILRSEHLTVLEKAIRICLECIGIG